eukprot:1138806-Rhodomonas_salina.1
MRGRMPSGGGTSGGSKAERSRWVGAAAAWGACLRKPDDRREELEARVLVGEKPRVGDRGLEVDALDQVVRKAARQRIGRFPGVAAPLAEQLAVSVSGILFVDIEQITCAAPRSRNAISQYHGSSPSRKGTARVCSSGTSAHDSPSCFAPTAVRPLNVYASVLRTAPTRSPDPPYAAVSFVASSMFSTKSMFRDSFSLLASPSFAEHCSAPRNFTVCDRRGLSWPGGNPTRCCDWRRTGAFVSGVAASVCHPAKPRGVMTNPRASWFGLEDSMIGRQPIIAIKKQQIVTEKSGMLFLWRSGAEEEEEDQDGGGSGWRTHASAEGASQENFERARRGVAAAMSMAGGYGAIPVSTSAPQRRGQRLGLVASVAAVAAVCLLAVVAMKGQTRRTVLHDVQVHNSTRRALRCPALTHHVVA